MAAEVSEANACLPDLPVEGPVENLWWSLIEHFAPQKSCPPHTVIFVAEPELKLTFLAQQLRLCNLEELSSGHPVPRAQAEDSLKIATYSFWETNRSYEKELTHTFQTFHCWLAQYQFQRDFLREILTPSNLSHLTVVVCVDLTRPWTILETLSELLRFSCDTLEALLTQLPLQDQDALRQRLVDYLQKPPEISIAEMLLSQDEPARDVDLPTVNFGVPFIICVMNSAFVSNLDTRKHPGRNDVLLAHLRRTALQCELGSFCRKRSSSDGAAVCYCDARDERKCGGHSLRTRH